MASGSLSVVEHRLLDENVDMSPLITRINRDQIIDWFDVTGNRDQQPTTITQDVIPSIGFDNFVRCLRESKQNELADYLDMPEETRKEFRKHRRWITLKPRFMLPGEQNRDVKTFLYQFCQSREYGSFRGWIRHEYSFLVEHVEADPLGVLVLPTRMDRFTKFLEVVRRGAFQSIVNDLLRVPRNNHGFGVTWDLDVTAEGVPQEASGDGTHAQSPTDEEETMRKHPVEE